MASERHSDLFKDLSELVRKFVNRFRPWLIAVSAFLIILIEPLSLTSIADGSKLFLGFGMAFVAVILTIMTGFFPKSMEEERKEIKGEFEREYNRKRRDYRAKIDKAEERLGYYNELSALAVRDLEVAIRLHKTKPDDWINKAKDKIDDCEKMALQLVARGMANILSVRGRDIVANLMIPRVIEGERYLKVVKYGGGDGRSKPLGRGDAPIPLKEDISGAPKAFLSKTVQVIPDIEKEPHRKDFVDWINVESRFRSVLSLPLFSDGDGSKEVIAVVNLDSPEASAFSDEDKLEQFTALSALWCYILSSTVTLHDFIHRDV